jgi:hypothetical protein
MVVAYDPTVVDGYADVGHDLVAELMERAKPAPRACTTRWPQDSTSPSTWSSWSTADDPHKS